MPVGMPGLGEETKRPLQHKPWDIFSRGVVGWAAWSSSYSRNARLGKGLVRRPHSRVNQATLDKKGLDWEKARSWGIYPALPVWPISLVPQVSPVSRHGPGTRAVEAPLARVQGK